MIAIIAERKIMTTKTKIIPPASNRIYNVGEEILVYSDNEKKWVGPVIIVDITKK